MTNRIVFIFLVLLIAATDAFAQPKYLSPEQKQRFDLLKKEMPELKTTWDSTLKTTASITRINSPVLDLAPAKVRDYFLKNFDVFFSLGDAGEIQVSKPETLQRGFKKIVLSQTFKHIPVYGRMLNLNFDDKNRLISISGKWFAVTALDVAPGLSRDEALSSIFDYIGKAGKSPLTDKQKALLKPDASVLTILHLGLSQPKAAGDIRLAYEVRIKTETFFVDARKGGVILHLTNYLNARNRETYTASCGGGLATPPGTLIVNESGPVGGAVPDAETQNAHDFAGLSYDYFQTTFGRDGYDTLGATIVSVVHSGVPVDIISQLLCCLLQLPCCAGCDQMNAGWVGSPYNRFLYGDAGSSGAVTLDPFPDALDVVAHEFTHAVTTYSIHDPATGDPVGLDYIGESGALNEAFSDIFACMIDRNDWLMGEDIVVAGYASGAMRNLADPTNGGQYNASDPIASVQAGNLPNHYTTRYTGTDDHGGVHVNCGIIAYAAYLMAEGGTHPLSGIHVNAIGRNATEKIFYRLLTSHVTNTSTFLDARHGALDSADETFPGDAAKYAAVWNAFTAVGIFDPNIPEEALPYAAAPGRDPVSIVLTLDFSNSMNSPVEPGGRNKIEILKDAVEIFLRTWEVFAIPGDRVGIVYFNTTVDPSPVSLLPLLGNIDTLVSQVRGRNAEQWTAMGGGLQVALSGLAASGAGHPHIINFTNGMQNVNPLVVNTGAQFEIINSAPAYWVPSNIPPNPGVGIQTYGIPVHTIGIGIALGGAYHQLLQEVSTATGGRIHLTMEPDADLRQFFLEDLATALDLNTVEIVKQQNKVLDQGQNLIDSVSLGAGVTKAAFILHWKNGEAESLRDFIITNPDNVSVQPSRVMNGSYYQIAIIDFRANHMRPAGVWKLLARQNASQNTSYQISVLVDETEIHYRLGFLPRAWAGDQLLLTAVVTDGKGRSLANLDSVKVEIGKPRFALGNILAQSRERFNEKEATDAFTDPASFKLQGLVKNGETRTKFGFDKVVVELRDTGENGDRVKGDGVYSVLFKDTQIPGVYRLGYGLKNGGKDGPFIERSKIMSVLLKPKPDLLKSALTVEQKTAGKDRLVTLHFTPQTADGAFLGPGQKGNIRLSVSNGEVTSIVDNQDGSYDCVVKITDPKKSYALNLRVSGFTLFQSVKRLIK